MAQPSAPENENKVSAAGANVSLYVGDLHADVNEADLYDIFNAVGPVTSIHVCRDAGTRRSLGYAYVNFQAQVDAEKALQEMNFTQIKGRPCRIMWSQRDPSARERAAKANLYVANLDETIDTQTLHDTFSMFGNITSCKVVVDKETGKSKGYGFVNFEFEEAAAEAIEKISGMMIADKEVLVCPFKQQDKGDQRDQWTNTYVKNFPQDWETPDLTKAMAEWLDGVGTRSVLVCTDKKGRKFAFVDFESHEVAKKAVETLTGKPVLTVEGRAATESGRDVLKEWSAATTDEQKEELEPLVATLYVNPHQRKSERERELAANFESSTERVGQTNVFVKSLHPSVDDETLRKEFEQFGVITSAKVMRGDKDAAGSSVDAAGNALAASKGFGFVNFSTSEEAARAVTEMNGRAIAGKPVYVALAQKKADRRAQLEARHAAQANPMTRGMPMQGGAPMVGFPGAAPIYFQGGIQTQQRGQGNYAAAYGMPQQMMPRGMPPAAGRGGPVQYRGAPQPMYPQMVPGGNARGARPRPRQQAPEPRLQQRPPAAAVSPPPLTAALLANASAVEQKNMIGERLYPLIRRTEPDLVGKITGMLLEMDNPELLHLLESPEALSAKVNEAIIVLEQHKQQATQ